MAKICMVAYTHYITDSRVRREAEALANRGDVVDFISLGYGEKVVVEQVNQVRLIKIPVSRYRGASAMRYIFSYLQFFLRVSVLLAKLHLKNRYQVIQVHTMPDFMVFVAIFPKFLGAKVILDVHDLMPELYQSKFGYTDSHLLIRFITWMERSSIRFADYAIAVHKPHLDALCRHGNPPSKFIVLLNLPDMKVLEYGGGNSYTNTEPGFELIYHGTISERHGLEVAIHAVSILKEKIQGLRLKIIGDGDDVQRLMRLIDELDLRDFVKIKQGMVPLNELVGEIRCADVGVIPLLYDDFTKFMLPVKLLEYVALNIPVICSRTETIEAYFDDSMIQYSFPGSVTELADNIENLYLNPKRMIELKINASKFNANYSWEKQKRIYYELIDNLVENRKNII